MKRYWFASIVTFLLAVVLLVPVFSFAAGAQEPLLTDEWMEFRRDLAEWQSEKFLQALDIMQAGFQEAEAVVVELGGSIGFPDLTSPRAEVLSLASDVASAADDAQSKQALSQLHAYINDFAAGGRARGDNIKQQVDALIATLRDSVKAEVDLFVEGLKETTRDEIESLKEDYRQTLVADVGGSPTEEQQATIQQQVRGYVQELAAQKQTENKALVEAMVAELSQPNIDGMTRLRQAFEDIQTNLNDHKAQVEAEAKEFQERRKALILKTVDARLAEAQQRWAALSPEQKTKLGIANLETELASARAQLEADLQAAVGEGAIQQALQSFRTRWQDAAKEVEANRMTAQELSETLLPKLTTQEEKLIQLIETLRDNHPGSETVQAAYQTVLAEVQQLIQACNQVSAETPASELAPALQQLQADADHAKQLLEAFKSNTEKPSSEGTEQ